MAQCYIELRKSTARGAESLAADIMRHLHARQHLGKTVVVCDQPVGMLSAARKQWLRLSRCLQKERAATLNADKILKFTHAITRMQHMGFSAKTPLHSPEAAVYFLRPEDLHVMPVQCYTTYFLTALSTEGMHALLAQLPHEALVVDYLDDARWQQQLGLIPKQALEDRVERVWQEVCQFLTDHHIAIQDLITDDIRNVELMDEALDTLLGTSHHFLRIANEFQRALELARPVALSKELRTAYDSFILLAHRVEALSPGSYSQHYLENYSEDDSFFLYDAAHGQLRLGGETLAEAYLRHQAAGRLHLAQALLRLSSAL